ncbi:7058_t:CDS:1, partial [Gigaspora margarita]
EEVRMVEWYQPVSDSLVSLNQNLSIPESHLPNIDQAGIAKNSNEQSLVFPVHQINKDTLYPDSIITLGKQVKNRKPKSKSIQISDSPNIISGVITARSFKDKSIIHKPTKKVGEKNNLYTLIERDRKETEEAEHESERILNS